MEDVIIGGKMCHIFQNGQGPCPSIYWGIGAGERHDWQSMPELLGREKAYLLVIYQVEDWDRDLSPWPAPAVFGKENFAGEAPQTLDWLLNTCVPYMKSNYGAGQSRILGGYSLAGLFSLWAFYESGMFQGVASCSGSLWYPGWDAYMQSHTAPENSLVYLSLGAKEERTRNEIMAQVGDATRAQYKISQKDANITRCILEWNPGGHFKDQMLRVAKGFQWLLKEIDET